MMSGSTLNTIDAPAGRRASVQFSLSIPGSRDSSRSSSPARPSGDDSFSLRRTGNQPLGNNTFEVQELMNGLQRVAAASRKGSLGRSRQVDVYDALLPRWRAAIRRRLVKAVRRESDVIAKMQDVIRAPWLDAYFVYTSSLGTHTFFMILIPAFFFFGYEELGIGLIMVLALGVYCASFVKDLVCSPRPFAPPVTRLTIGTHHLEYGFPSTHSTNSVSIALYFFAHVHQLATIPSSPRQLVAAVQSTTSTVASTVLLNTVDAAASVEPVISAQLYNAIMVVLSIYTFSIVFGRLYTAMHSLTDCVAGVAMGAAIWWAHSSWAGIPVALSPSNPLYWLYVSLWPSALNSTGTLIMHVGKGLGAGKWIDSWVRQGGWEVPLILVPLFLLAVNQHPQPVDDCPCFEDAIAFGSVVLGALVGSWVSAYYGFGGNRVTVMPGSGWVYEMGQWIQVERTWRDVAVWWSFAALKMSFGILVIFAWRILAKSMLHLVLPPTFRTLARVFQLPHRRFYTPATDYKSVPSEFNAGDGGFGIRPIPSVIDLPRSATVGVEIGGIGSGSGVRGAVAHANGDREIKMRLNGAAEKARLENGRQHVEPKGEPVGKDNLLVKHYDADVLTKVVVYSGIAILVANVLPALFEVLGWGVRSWVE